MINDIIKTCKTHGALKREQVVKKTKSATGEQLYRCKACLSIFHRNHYEKNRERLLKQTKDFNNADRERYLTRKRKYSKKYRELHGDEERLRIRKQDRKYIDNLDDRYVKKLLTKRSNMKGTDMPQQLINLKRVIVKIKRKVKEIKDNNEI